MIQVSPQLITEVDYHAHEAISNTKLKAFRESRKLYFARHVAKTLEFTPTPAMQLGSLVHAIVFEPEAVPDRYAIAIDVDRRTKDGKAAWAAFQEIAIGKEVIDLKTYEQAQRIANALLANPVTKSFMDTVGDCEAPLFWTDPVTGMPCRCKVDKLCSDIDVILDLKVVQDSTPAGFARAVVSFEYDCQAAWYAEAYRAIFGFVPNFVFVAISKTEPYEIGFYELEESDLAAAREINAKTLASLKACMESSDWESQHETSVVRLKLPRYAQFRSDYTQLEGAN